VDEHGYLLHRDWWKLSESKFGQVASRSRRGGTDTATDGSDFVVKVLCKCLRQGFIGRDGRILA
jgi:hypothetical protein